MENPRNARPSWVNFFSRTRLPKTMVVSTQQGAVKAARGLSGGLRAVQISLPFDYPYDAFPSEINLFLRANFKEQRPYVSFYWLSPDGKQALSGDGGDYMPGEVKCWSVETGECTRSWSVPFGGRLTALFEEAKFSDHVVDERMREDALGALSAIRRDLRRGPPDPVALSSAATV